MSNTVKKTVPTTQITAQATAIPGLLFFDVTHVGDDRGYFQEKYQKSKLVAAGMPESFTIVQNSVSFNKEQGVVRGFHAEPWDKYISVVTGRVFAAYVDLRKGPTFGTVATITIDSNKTVFLPQGVANSFQTLEPDTYYLYSVNAHWSAEASEGRLASWRVNATGVRNLAAVAAARSMTLVHISSDYVFDGTASPHREDEPFSPLNVYGNSKAAGDIAASLVPQHYILRTTWVIGEGKNFVRTMLGLAQKGISPTVVGDQIGRLTFTSELVRAIDHLLTNKAAYGTYNVTNSGNTASWADITRTIFKQSGHADLMVTDTTTAEYFAGKSGIAPRPLLSEMDLSKIQATGFHGRDWQDDLNDYIAKEEQQT